MEIVTKNLDVDKVTAFLAELQHNNFIDIILPFSNFFLQ